MTAADTGYVLAPKPPIVTVHVGHTALIRRYSGIGVQIDLAEFKPGGYAELVSGDETLVVIVTHGRLKVKVGLESPIMAAVHEMFQVPPRTIYWLQAIEAEATATITTVPPSGGASAD